MLKNKPNEKNKNKNWVSKIKLFKNIQDNSNRLTIKLGMKNKLSI